jgi:hypothetical protein
MLPPVADLEKHAFRRDRRFLVRLVLAVAAAAIFGAFVFAKMTDPSIATCAADAFQSATTPEGDGGTAPEDSRP